MDNRILVNQPLRPVKSINQPRQQQPKGSAVKGPSFKEALAERLKKEVGIDFSKHAQQRLLTRGIEVSAGDLAKLEDGVTKAAQKGGRESLIIVNKVAYLVSIENKKVITAIDDASLKESVFTNIDSAVFM